MAGVNIDRPQRTKVAIVGVGAWWGMQHARVFHARDDVDLCAIVGRDIERTAERARRFGTRPYTNLDEMLERERPDLVSLCLPNEEHFALTLQVIRAGFPLFVEKPLVFDLAEADMLLAAAAQQGLFFGINFNHRYARPVRMAAQAIGEGRLGELSFATWRFGGETGTSAHPFANLIETQCHGLDMLEHLCGPIGSVMAQMTDVNGRRATLAVALAFVGGAVGSLVGSYQSSYAYPGTHLLEINGSAGRVVVEDTVQRYSFHAAGDEVGQVWQAGYFNDTDRTFHHTFDRHIDEMLPALRAGEPPPVHARAGRRALLLAHAIVESFESGRRVDVPVADDGSA
jgi:myo-inositol 2-dehydrogenase / D-chiro-inositol 1-dehydrogenase